VNKNLRRNILIAFLAVAAAFAFSTVAYAQYTESLLYEFHYTDGLSPVNFLFDPSGTIYGVSSSGGSALGCTGCGNVYKLVPTSSGPWTQTVLHTFGGPPDAGIPFWGVVEDSSGNLFGATVGNGTASCSCGAVYELSPNGDGTFTYKVIYSFTDGADGRGPLGVVIGPDGNLYGDAQAGGTPACAVFSSGCGTIFQLSPPAVEGDPWNETTLYTFTGGRDGLGPQVPIFDHAGNLYGFASNGGNSNSAYCASLLGCGTVFRLSPSSSGWQFSVLYSFTQSTGANPAQNAPVLDAAGNIYGTNAFGGRSCASFSIGCGTIFKIAPTASGPWTFSLLHAFTGNSDGAEPLGALALDASGNVYGTAFNGGSTSCGSSIGCGTVYKISPAVGGGWQFARIWAFPGAVNGGYFPESGVIVDPAGNIFGSTSFGGSHQDRSCQVVGCGVIYKLSSTSAAH
jgi:hypothetical protein